MRISDLIVTTPLVPSGVVFFVPPPPDGPETPEEWQERLSRAAMIVGLKDGDL